MKQISLVLALVFVGSIPSTSAAAPKSGAQFPTSKAPGMTVQPLTKVNAKPKSNGGGKTMLGAGTHSGVLKSMLVNKNGEIVELYMKLSGSVHTQRIKGCGAKSAAHPVLNWVFQERRLVHITTNASGCLGNVLIPR